MPNSKRSTAGSVLVTGGAGYIGSHAVHAFRAAGYTVVVLDDLSTGHRLAVPRDVVLVEGDVGDFDLVCAVIAEHGVTAVDHVAASVSVPESMTDPGRFYCNNSGATGNLIRACIESRVKKFIFSSTAAVYGVPPRIPVAEDVDAVPINPYGRSKLVTEWMLRDVAAAHDFQYVALRCFNVAGADPGGQAGCSEDGTKRLFKVACQAAVGARDSVTVFGTDYDTVDGTCVRDYIHVSDLAAAHVAALEGLEVSDRSHVLNCGYGHGFSVYEILETAKALSPVPFEIRDGPRRAGDPPALVADSSRIRRALQWVPRYDDLELIMRTAIAWEAKLVRDGGPQRNGSG